MKYPTVSKWVTRCEIEDDNCITYVYDDLNDLKYRMSKREFCFFCQLDGKVDPYTIQSSLTSEQRTRFLKALAKTMLISRTKTRLGSFVENHLILCFAKVREVLSKRAAVLDSVLSAFWLPIFLTGSFYLLTHFDTLSGSDCAVLGCLFGLILGSMLSKLAKVIACLHWGGEVSISGVGFDISMDTISSRKNRSRVYAARTKMSLLISGTLMFLACFLPGAGGFMFFASVANLFRVLTNMLFLDGTDGSWILSELIGCQYETNIFQYAKDTVHDKKKRKALCDGGINGWMILCIDYMVCFLNVVLHVFLALSLVLVILVFRGVL